MPDTNEGGVNMFFWIQEKKSLLAICPMVHPCLLSLYCSLVLLDEKLLNTFFFKSYTVNITFEGYF